MLNKKAVFAAGLLLVGGLYAADTPKISPELYGKIRDTQLQISQDETTIERLKEAYNDAQNDLSHAQGVLTKYKEDALKEANLDPKDWKVEDRGLTFIKTPSVEEKK